MFKILLSICLLLGSALSANPTMAPIISYLLSDSVPVANAGVDQNVSEGEIVTLTSVATDSYSTIASYEWKEGGTTLSTSFSFSKSDFSIGAHTVTLIVTDNVGGTGYDTVIVNIEASEQDTPFLSNAYDVGLYIYNSKPAYYLENYYIVKLNGSSTDIMKITEEGLELVASKTKGEENAGGDGDIAVDDNVFISFAAYEHSWASPTFYGTDFGVLELEANSSVYNSIEPVSGYDWDGTVSIMNNQEALLVRRNSYDIVMNKYNYTTNTIGTDITIENDDENGIGTIQNPKGTYISNDLAAVVYEENSSDEFRITFFSPSSGDRLSRILFHSDSTSSSFAGSTAISSNVNMVAVAISSTNLDEYGDISGKGILLGIYDNNQQLIKKTLVNEDSIIGDQVFPKVFVTSTNKILVTYQDYSTSNSYLLLYDSNGNLLDTKEFSGGWGSGISFGGGPSDSVLLSFNDYSLDGYCKVLKLDVSNGKIISKPLF